MGGRACPLPLSLLPRRFSLYVGSLSPTLQRPGLLGRVVAPKLPAQKLPSSGCGARKELACCSGRGRDGTRKQGRGTPRPDQSGKPQSCSWCPAQQAFVGGGPSRLSGWGPPEWEGDSPILRRPLGSKGQQCEAGLARCQALSLAPSLVSLWSPYSPSPARNPVITFMLAGEEVEAQGG